MASNGEEVRRAALAELARRELARRAQQQPSGPTVRQQAGRVAGLGGRMVAEGAVDIASPFADVAGMGLNALTSGYNAIQRRVNTEGYNVTVNGQQVHRSGQLPKLAQTQHSQTFSNVLTEAGLPKPEGTMENVSNVLGRMVTGAAAGGAIDDAVKGSITLEISSAVRSIDPV